MDELIKKIPSEGQSEDAYHSIRGYVIEAQGQVYTAVNAAMVTARQVDLRGLRRERPGGIRQAGSAIHFGTADGGIWKRL